MGYESDRQNKKRLEDVVRENREVKSLVYWPRGFKLFDTQ